MGSISQTFAQISIFFYFFLFFKWFSVKSLRPQPVFLLIETFSAVREGLCGGEVRSTSITDGRVHGFLHLIFTCCRAGLGHFLQFWTTKTRGFFYSQCPQNKIKSLFTHRAWPDFKLRVETETGWHLKKVSGSLIPESVQDYSHPLILASRTNLSPPKRVETAVVRQVIIIIRNTENILFLYSVKDDKSKYNPDFTSSATHVNQVGTGETKDWESCEIFQKHAFQTFLMIH